MRQTQSTTTYSRGEIVLVPFPFTDFRGATYRPALVVSNNAYNQSTRDLVIAQITGNISGRPRIGDHHITDWQGAGLLAPSVVRAKLATLEVTRVGRALGQMPSAEMQQIEANLRSILGL